jgi:hypothetical protein
MAQDHRIAGNVHKRKGDFIRCRVVQVLQVHGIGSGSTQGEELPAASSGVGHAGDAASLELGDERAGAPMHHHACAAIMGGNLRGRPVLLVVAVFRAVPHHTLEGLMGCLLAMDT